jgi:hypothetical protein
VSVPLPNFWPPVVVEKCHQKIPLGLLEVPTFDPRRPFARPSFLYNRYISRCWKEFDSRGEEHLLVLLTPEKVPLSNTQTCNRMHLVLSKIRRWSQDNGLSLGRTTDRLFNTTVLVCTEALLTHKRLWIYWHNITPDSATALTVVSLSVSNFWVLTSFFFTSFWSLTSFWP